MVGTTALSLYLYTVPFPSSCVSADFLDSKFGAIGCFLTEIGLVDPLRRNHRWWLSRVFESLRC